ncbi:hypothetical protein OXPF_40440 [Oxobacter pfennigii]|uniref:Inner membrane protein n=1 Tax=Oxobacter pfennigii TaxID=36849 RepID=A0A0P8W1H3_9CLOT|nr:metal-dependent hydrolase [Oxobacter pfennigii]KPU42260.1 hypothetical protein OXPF_40440 [Oxobacter pfennigii]
MDPITHGLIGMAVSAAGQNTFSILSPITVATVTGSILPDGDIVMRTLGNAAYLKHHRGGSHSLIGIALEAMAAGGVLKLFYPETSVFTLMLWVFIGTLTHILSDLLNSYGAKILWPLSNKKYTLCMLTITDPIILGLAAISTISSYKNLGYNKYIIAIFILYIMSKVFMHVYGSILLRREFCDICHIRKIHLLPSMIAFYKFQYIIEGSMSKIVGDINFLYHRVRVFDIFKGQDDGIEEHVLKSRTAKYFKEFTPIFHIDFEKINDGYKALLTDLRYILKGEFLHHATIIYDEKMNILEEKFNPYNINKNIDV